jgi:DNA-binding LacI/PurR family transcriptional regulator
VLKVMAELDFRPNFFAQALATQRSRSIALFTQDITNPFYPALARGVQHGLEGDDHALMLFDAATGDLGARVDVVIGRMVDGAILAVGDLEPVAARLGRAGLPVVAIGFPPPDALFDAVSADDEVVAADAVAYLHARGHQRIALVNGPSTAAPGAARRMGFRAAMARLGLPLEPGLEADADWTRDGGAAAAARLLDLPDPPTAAFCANDLMAIGALDAAFTRGLRVPEDLAVIGVDDIDAAGLVRPALTTIALDPDAMGRVAAALLLRRLRGDASPPERVLIPHRLVERESA